jgi:hypothetical protein
MTRVRMVNRMRPLITPSLSAFPGSWRYRFAQYMKSTERSLLVFSCALFSLAAIAEESIDDEKHGGEEGHGKNTLGLFVGVTHEHDHDLATLGIEYAYRFHENWSVGGHCRAGG